MQKARKTEKQKGGRRAADGQTDTGSQTDSRTEKREGGRRAADADRQTDTDSPPDSRPEKRKKADGQAAHKVHGRPDGQMDRQTDAQAPGRTPSGRADAGCAAASASGPGSVLAGGAGSLQRAQSVRQHDPAFRAGFKGRTNRMQSYLTSRIGYLVSFLQPNV
jgi:hypothetical protein